MMRVSWRSVGRIVTRVVGDAEKQRDPFSRLRYIGIDEISYRKGHRYLTVVVDHESGDLLWAGVGASKKTLDGFFDLLGEARSAKIELVSADAAGWIASVVKERCPKATLCLDPFHVVSWATNALDEVRRDVWNEARRQGQKAQAKELKGARFALWKNPEDLTERQQAKLRDIADTNRPLYRAYLLKEQLRQVFKFAGKVGVSLLDDWLAWACRSRLAPFVKLSRRLREYRPAIDAALTHRLSNGRVESMNTKIRLIIRRAFGFHSAGAIIALAMLTLGGLCPSLPGRA